MNSKAVGELSEAIILAHLMRKGWSVSIPFGNNQRYDMLVDTGEHILRAQCKTGRSVRGCVEFATSSKNGFTGVRTAYADQVDIFLIYFPKTDAIYMFPAEDATATFVNLRIEPNKGGATSKIRWAEKYRI